MKTDLTEEPRQAQAAFFQMLDDSRVQCLLCPHNCLLKPGQWGICKVRTNYAGTLSLPLYGHISSLAIDPVEKKPLLHFMPGSYTFSAGFWHCNMKCPFCQNWSISHPNPRIGKRTSVLPPEALVQKALDSGCPSISLTYSEPTIHIEYALETFKLAKAANLATILVTNGTICSEPAEALLRLTEAVNVDMKTASEERYKNILGGDLQTVKNFIQIASQYSHLEVTSLLVPGILDQPDEIRIISEFLASISPQIPLHITPYHPDFNYTQAPLRYQQMQEIAKPAYELLEYVHLYRPWQDR